MSLPGTLKGIGVGTLLVVSIAGVWYSVIVVATAGRWFWLGFVVLAVALRGVILAYDIMWGRPPQFSDRPWERPWEE